MSSIKTDVIATLQAALDRAAIDGNIYAEVRRPIVFYIIQTLKEQPCIVRCKDCKHRPTQTEPGKSGFTLEFPDSRCPCQCEDGFYSWYPPDNWFCADGWKSE